MGSREARRPLEGIRVLDLTRLLPGPYATLLLADLGADVVKVEDPGDGGDFVRFLPPTVPTRDGTPDVGALFVALNRNKRSLALDLKKPAGVAVFRRLAEKADVVIEGFRPGVLDRLGIGWSALSAVNPRLVMAAISGYGQDGPYAQRAGHDLNYIALAGLLGIGGPAEGPPAIPGAPVADLSSSLIAVGSILAALLGRERAGPEGRGTYLDVSMYDCALGLMIAHLPGALAGAGLARGEVGLTGRDPNYRVYRTRDGRWLSVANLEPKFWARFVKAIERPDLANGALESQIDPKRRAVLHQELETLFAQRTQAEWVASLAGADCCIEPVLEGAEVLDHPHAKARGAVTALDDARFKSVALPRTPFNPWSRSVTPTASPRAGEHSERILAESGFTPGEIAALRSDGVLG